MTRQEAFSKLEAMDRKLVMLEHVASTLAYDQETALSPLGLEERSLQMGWISSQIHELSCSQEMAEVLGELGCDSAHPEGLGEDDFEKGLIRFRFRDFDRQRRLPTSLVSELAITGSRAHESWVEARTASDWSLFLKDFSAIVDLAKQKAACLQERGQQLYDAALNLFEPGMKTQEVGKLFGSIKPKLIELTDRISSYEVDDSFLRQEYDVAKQEEFSRKVLNDMLFDFNRGSLAVAVHPFTSTLGMDDIRITTRYTDPRVADALSSTIHEGGHALYEMGASTGRLKGTCLANGASLGLHESQSRLWENMVGKSPDFWEHYYPYFKSLFPSQTEGVSLDLFVKALNKVERTPIRVNADEVSYSLHIMLRFELEQEILGGNIPLSDLPEAWNQKTREMLGFTPKNNSQGVLQDVHWSSGDFGYFPTYALGNLYGAQIWEKMGKEMDLPLLLRKGELPSISTYLKEHIYTKGAMYESPVLLSRLTNKPLDASLFTSYLEGKFSRVYGY